MASPAFYIIAPPCGIDDEPDTQAQHAPIPAVDAALIVVVFPGRLQSAMPLPVQLPRLLGAPTSWDEADASVREQPAMRDAVEYFRRLLGEGWRGWMVHSHLARSFHTSFQGLEREWVRLHRLARALEGVEESELLIKDLGSAPWGRHVAAEQALEFCGRMRAAGHRVEIVKPTQDKSPDVRVWLHDRPVTIEFKALHDPDAQIPWDDFFDALHGELFRRRLGADFFPFDVAFSEPALEHLHDVADALAAIAVSGDVELYELPHGSGRARYVADPTAMRELRFPVDQRADLDRIVASLGAKYRRQLRDIDGPTLLVVLTKSIFFVRDEHIPAVVRHVAATLRETVAQRTTIGGLLLHEEPLEVPRGPVSHVDDGWRFAMCTTEGRGRTALLLRNGAASVGLTEPELDVLVGENMHW